MPQTEHSDGTVQRWIGRAGLAGLAWDWQPVRQGGQHLPRRSVQLRSLRPGVGGYAMTNAEDPNPFRQAARKTWLAAERFGLEPAERERLLRQGQWYEEEAARWDLRRGPVPVPQSPDDEALPRRVPGQSWEAVTGMPLDHNVHSAIWNPADPGPATLQRMASALRQMPP